MLRRELISSIWPAVLASRTRNQPPEWVNLNLCNRVITGIENFQQICGNPRINTRDLANVTGKNTCVRLTA